MNNPITVEATVKAPVEKVWMYYNEPERIKQWAFAMDTWQCPSAENDLREGGRFKTRMEAKDGSAGFDFGGTYQTVKENECIEYTMDDGREARVDFSATPEGTKVTVLFEAEEKNPRDMQASGWQAILNNFKKHVENN
jgi:uncharacterized protein YndB with AHSA1/START domain